MGLQKIITESKHSGIWQRHDKLMFYALNTIDGFEEWGRKHSL